MLDDYWFLEWAGEQRWAETFKPFKFGGREEYGKYWFNASRIDGHSGEAYFRPLVSVAYKAVRTVFGLDSRAYHLSSIALHVLTSLIVLWVAGLFFRAREPAFVTALAFAVHPAHGEPVQWLAANTHLLVAPSYFLALGFYLRSRDPDGRWWHYALALAFSLLALCAHELAVTLPAVMLAADWWRAQADRSRDPAGLWPTLQNLAWRILPFAIIAGAYLVWHFDVLRSMQKEMVGSAYLHDVSRPLDFARSALFQLTYGLSHLFLPFPFAPLDVRDLEPALGRLPLALGCAAVLALLVWLWVKMGGRDPRMLVAAVIFLVPFAPSLLVSPAERQLYVPSLGFCLLLGLFYERLSLRGRALRTPVIALASIAIVLTWAYNVMWSFPSNVARSQVEELRRQLPAPDRDSSIYILNLWGPALGMEMMPGMLSDNPKLDVQVLTIHPKVLPVGEYRVSNPLLQRFFAAILPGAVGEAQVETTWESPDVLRVQIRNGRFMRSLIEQTYPAAAVGAGRGCARRDGAFQRRGDRGGRRRRGNAALPFSARAQARDFRSAGRTGEATFRRLAPAERETRNPKFETRSKLQNQSRIEVPTRHPRPRIDEIFRPLIFELSSSFEFRVSSFPPALTPPGPARATPVATRPRARR